MALLPPCVGNKIFLSSRPRQSNVHDRTSPLWRHPCGHPAPRLTCAPSCKRILVAAAVRMCRYHACACPTRRTGAAARGHQSRREALCPRATWVNHRVGLVEQLRRPGSNPLCVRRQDRAPPGVLRPCTVVAMSSRGRGYAQARSTSASRCTSCSRSSAARLRLPESLLVRGLSLLPLSLRLGLVPSAPVPSAPSTKSWAALIDFSTRPVEPNAPVHARARLAPGTSTPPPAGTAVTHHQCPSPRLSRARHGRCALPSTAVVTPLSEVLRCLCVCGRVCPRSCALLELCRLLANVELRAACSSSSSRPPSS